MILYSSKYRSQQQEIMDDAELSGDSLATLLNDLKKVNTLLGGFSITLDGVETLVLNSPKTTSLTLLDLGCGDGESLRKCAQFMRKQQRTMKFIGVDMNEHILEIAKEKSNDYPEISYLKLNILEKNQQLPNFDIATCNLFLHHFPEHQIIELLNKLIKQGKRGVVINDLRRSKLAFQLFKIFGLLFMKSKIAKHDGLVSIARAFKRKELKKMAEKLNGEHIIKGRWAFRYQWLIKF